MKFFLLLIFAISLACITPKVTFALPLEVSAFTRDIGGYMLLNVPVDFDVGWAQYEGDRSIGGRYCYRQDCESVPGCDAQDNSRYALAFNRYGMTSINTFSDKFTTHWDVWPEGSDFITLNPKSVDSTDRREPIDMYNSAGRLRGGWTTIRQDWGNSYNSLCSPIKATVLTDKMLNGPNHSWLGYTVDHIEGDIFLDVNMIKFTCARDKCICNDGPNCVGVEEKIIENKREKTFWCNERLTNCWVYAGVHDGEATNIEFILRPKRLEENVCLIENFNSKI